MSEKVLVDREQLERAASIIAWMSCRSDIKAADLKRLEQCASELSCALTAPADLSSDERVAGLVDALGDLPCGAKLYAAQPEANVLVEALEELIDLMEDTRQGEYIPDSFTTQPARIALAAYRKGEEAY